MKYLRILACILMAVLVSCSNSKKAANEDNKIQTETNEDNLLKETFVFKAKEEGIKQDTISREGDIEVSVAKPIKETSDQTDYVITIKKELLKKDLMLNVAYAGMAPEGSGEALASKLVFFEKQGDQLVLFESMKGKVTTDSIPSYKLLVEFPITKETPEGYEIDFKKGFDRLYFQGAYYIEGFPSSAGESNYKVAESYIKQVKNLGDSIFVEQISNLELDNQEALTLALKITFTPYKANPNFIPKKSPYKTGKIGYFTNQPVTEAGIGRENIYAMRFDISNGKKITYYTSPSVPGEFKQAVAEGILYWNNVFGKDVLEVKDLPEGIDPHTPGYNIVWWLENDVAGGAYADMMTDPVTGELIQTHVYMTSVFATYGKFEAFREMVTQQDPSPKSLVKLKGFESQKICHHQMNWKGLDSIIQQVGTTDEQILRFSQDVVRSVIAHEVGHTLGLRHNFAGNHANTITPATKEEITQKYLITGEVDEKTLTSSSVMEYSSGFDDAITGGKIRLKHPALPYDAKAIEWGYTDISIDELQDVPTFCTDNHAGSYIDCAVWDSYADSMTDSLETWKEGISKLPKSLAISFLRAKIPVDEEDVKPMEDVKIDPLKTAKVLASSFSKVLSHFNEETYFMEVDKGYRYFSSQNLERNDEESKNYVLNQLLPKVGGLSSIFKTVLSDELFILDQEKLYQEFLTIISSSKFKSGQDYLGRDFAFSDQEMNTMAAEGEIFFHKFTDYIREEVVQALIDQDAKRLINDKEKGIDLASQQEKFLGDLAQHILFKDSEKEIKTTVGDIELKVKDFFYSYDLRENSIFLLDTLQNTGTRYFNEKNADKVANKLEDMVESILTKSDATIQSEAEVLLAKLMEESSVSREEIDEATKKELLEKAKEAVEEEYDAKEDFSEELRAWVDDLSYFYILIIKKLNH